MQVRLIGLVGAAPDVRRVGDQTIAQVSLGIRPKTGNTNEISWVVCDFWNHEVFLNPPLPSLSGTHPSSCIHMAFQGRNAVP